MSSNDVMSYVTRDEFNARMDNLEAITQTTHDELQLTNVRLEWMQTTIYWGFAIMGVVVAFISVFVPITLAFVFRWFDKKDEKPQSENKGVSLSEVLALMSLAGKKNEG